MHNLVNLLLGYNIGFGYIFPFQYFFNSAEMLMNGGVSVSFFLGFYGYRD